MGGGGASYQVPIHQLAIHTILGSAVPSRLREADFIAPIVSPNYSTLYPYCAPQPLLPLLASQANEGSSRPPPHRAEQYPDRTCQPRVAGAHHGSGAGHMIEQGV